MKTKAKTTTPEAAELADLAKSEAIMRRTADAESAKIRKETEKLLKANDAAILKLQRMQKQHRDAEGQRIAKVTNTLAAWLEKANRRRRVLEGRGA